MNGGDNLDLERLGPGRVDIVYTSYYGDLDGGGELRMRDHILGSTTFHGRFGVVLLSPGDLEARLRSDGVPTATIPWNWAWSRPRRWLSIGPTRHRLGRLLSRLKPLAVAANTFLDLRFAAPAARASGHPICWRSRAEVFPNLRPDDHDRARRIAAFVEKHVAVVTATTRYDADLIVKAGVPAERVRLVYNGVDFDVYRRARLGRDRMREGLGIRPEEHVAAFVGRFTSLKGHDTFLRALDRARARVPGLRALVVGYTAEEPEYEASVRSLAAELGLGDAVTFLGYRRDIPDLLAASDLYVSASRRETFGTSIVEAMAAGLPIVATATAGAREILATDRTGIVVPIDDVGAMADALVHLAVDHASARRLADAALAYGFEQFEWHRSIAALDRACADAARTGRRRNP